MTPSTSAIRRTCRPRPGSLRPWHGPSCSRRSRPNRDPSSYRPAAVGHTLAWLDRPQQPSRSMRPRQPQQAKASSFRYPPGSAPRDPPPGKLKPLYTRSNSESVAFEQQSISIVARRRTFNARATPALRPSMLLQAHAGQRGTSVAQATSLGWLIWSEPVALRADRLPAPQNPAKKCYGGNCLCPAGACHASRARLAVTGRP
jgi:hypothetical protein